MADNVLYYGDNLDILRRYIKDESIDLIYLDPPFNSKATYNVLFAEKNGTQSAAQIKAFDDTWHWDMAAAEALYQVQQLGGRPAEAMKAFEGLLGHNDMFAYLCMMAVRLVELRRVLKHTGSIYLHCDPTASHYLKVLMDAIFGAAHFQNEFVWYYSGGGASKQRWAGKHDILLYYTRGSGWTFNADAVRVPYKWTDGQRRADGSERDLVSGKLADDVWEHHSVMPWAKERLGYPTQKPEALLERVILASSNQGDIVLDPFCGCGTTIAVAQRLNRCWIGIDITHLAIGLIKKRLADTFPGGVDYKVIGEPASLPDAQALAEQDRFEFQQWALGLVGARPTDPKRGADKGIDGRLYFHDDPKGRTRQIVLSVKSGGVSVKDVRDLRGVMDREKAELGVLITLELSTGPMRSEAINVGFYESPWGKHPRLQILTVEALLEGKKIDMPPLGQVNVTFKKAPKAKGKDEVSNSQML